VKLIHEPTGHVAQPTQLVIFTQNTPQFLENDLLKSSETYFRGSMAIFFHSIDTIPVKLPKAALKRWINTCVEVEKHTIGTINIIFCSDEYLLAINLEHLQHDYLTDIITFDYTTGTRISGDLYVSIERLRENALKFGVSVQEELYRVVIHGVMHLCGYKDKTKKDAATMRKQEENCLLKLRECLGFSSFT